MNGCFQANIPFNLCSPNRARTCDSHVKSMVLYQLSYRGVYPQIYSGIGYCLYLLLNVIIVLVPFWGNYQFLVFYLYFYYCGPDGTRTHILLLAKEVLSQFSYWASFTHKKSSLFLRSLIRFVICSINYTPVLLQRNWSLPALIVTAMFIIVFIENVSSFLLLV